MTLNARLCAISFISPLVLAMTPPGGRARRSVHGRGRGRGAPAEGFVAASHEDDATTESCPHCEERFSRRGGGLAHHLPACRFYVARPRSIATARAASPRPRPSQSEPQASPASLLYEDHAEGNAEHDLYPEEMDVDLSSAQGTYRVECAICDQG
jgi:hypothetical protein